MMPPSDTNNSNGLPPVVESGRGALVPQQMFPPPASGTFTPPALATMPDATTLLKALRRRLIPATILGLIFAGIVGAATWYLFPPAKIVARCQLFVSSLPPQLLFEHNLQGNEAFRSTQLYLVKDRFTLTAALRENKELAGLSLLKDQEDPLQWLENKIQVSFPSPEMMHIALSGNQPDEQQKIVSAVTSAYLKMWVDRERNEFNTRQKKIEIIRQNMEAKAGAKRRELRTLQKEVGAVGEEGMAILTAMALRDLEAAKSELTTVRGQLRTLLVELGMQPNWLDRDWPQYAAILNSLPGPGLPINHAVVALLHDDFLISMASPSAATRDLDEVIDQAPEVAKVLKRIHEQQLYIAKINSAVKDPQQKKSRLRQANADLDKLKRSEKDLRDKLRPDLLAKHRRQVHTAGLSSREKNRETVRRLQALQKVLADEVQRLHEKSRQVKNQAVDLGTLTDEVEHSERFTKKAIEQLMEMEVEKEAPARVRQLDEGTVLTKIDNSKQRVMVTVGAAIAALALVLLAFAWFEFQSRKVHTADEVVHGLGLNLVGTVPDASPRSWLPWSGGGINAVYTQSMLTESVDSARTQLLHVAREQKLQIVMITSALAGEGKTSLASHLAASLARSGRRTIIVDSDLRNPTMHRLFERSRAPGLSELLRGEADLAEVSRDTDIPNLWLISAGKADAVALQALAFDAISKLFEELRLRYDFIIVDSCPVLPVADSLLVGQHVDGVIFSLLRQVSRMPRVYAAYQRLSMLGIRMLGAVINGTSHDLYPADYNYVASDGD